MDVLAFDAVVDFGLIGLYLGALLCHSTDEGQSNGGVGPLGSYSRNLTFAFLFLHHAYDGGFVVEHTFSFVLAAYIRFVDLNDTRQRIIALLHHESDLLGHAPSSFVGHAQVSFYFFGTDAVLAHTKEVDGVEPFFERCFGFVEDSIGKRANLMAAVLTLVHLLATDAMKLRTYHAALRAGS